MTLLSPQVHEGHLSSDLLPSVGSRQRGVTGALVVIVSEIPQNRLALPRPLRLSSSPVAVVSTWERAVERTADVRTAAVLTDAQTFTRDRELTQRALSQLAAPLVIVLGIREPLPMWARAMNCVPTGRAGYADLLLSCIADPTRLATVPAVRRYSPGR